MIKMHEETMVEECIVIQHFDRLSEVASDKMGVIRLADFLLICHFFKKFDEIE